MKTILKLFAMNFFLLFFLTYISVSQNNNSGTTAATFLKFGVGGRAAAMGNSSTATVDDASALYWNPGALGNINGFSLLLSYSKLFADMQHSFIGVSIPTSLGTVGLGAIAFSTGKMTRTEASPAGFGYIKGDEFSNLDIAGILSYGINLYQGSCIGFSVKYVRQSLDTKAADGFAADLGLIAQYKMVDFGLSVSNYGGKIKFDKAEYDLPMQIQAGLAIHLFENKATFSVSGGQVDKDENQYSIGAEYLLTDNFYLRAGYRTGLENISGSVKGITAGLGINLSGLHLDYGYNTYGDLGEVHHISLGFQLSPGSSK